MSKFEIQDDCNFSTLYLLHPKSIFDEYCWVGFLFKSSFSGKIFSSIQDVMKI